MDVDSLYENRQLGEKITKDMRVSNCGGNIPTVNIPQEKILAEITEQVELH